MVGQYDVIFYRQYKKLQRADCVQTNLPSFCKIGPVRHNIQGEQSLLICIVYSTPKLPAKYLTFHAKLCNKAVLRTHTSSLWNQIGTTRNFFLSQDVLIFNFYFLDLCILFSFKFYNIYQKRSLSMIRVGLFVQNG